MDNGTAKDVCNNVNNAISPPSDQQDTSSARLPSSHTLTPATGQAPSSHSRSASSGLFSKFSFLRPTEATSEIWQQSGSAPRSKTSIDDEDGAELRSKLTAKKFDDDPGRQSIVKQRKRKGSLRKSALLGVKRLGSDGRERRNSLLGRSTAAEHDQEKTLEKGDTKQQDAQSSMQGLGLDMSDRSQTIPTGSSTLNGPHSEVTVASLHILTAQQTDSASEPNKVESSSATLSSPSDSKSPTGYGSTTEDDDDALSIPLSSQLIPPIVPSIPPADPAATSYFPPQVLRNRTRSSRRLRPSPLQNAYAPVVEEIYSYTETEYWGWVILIVTWLLFTVGMGSCLDIWSWAWDVGETPYAPPELEDDPTLPIVGYYPALIVLTGVVSWVWITVAWIGMKYFRHAKIEV